MKKLVWLLILGVPLYLLYDHRPQLDDHREKIFQVASGYSLSDDYRYLPVWEELELRDFYIATAVQSREQKNMVSFGIWKWLTVVDKDWGKKAFDLGTTSPEKQ